MHISRHLGATSTLAFVIAAQSAFAEVTAKDVWGDWRGYLEGMGYSVTANEEISGKVLTLSNISMSVKMPEEAGSMSLEMGDMTLTEIGDGTVSIKIPEVMPVVFSAEAEGEDPVRMQLDYTHSGFEMIVSGSPNDMTYDYSADNMAMALASLNVEGETISPEDISLRISMVDLSGKSTMKTGEMRETVQELKVSALSYDMNVTDPSGSGGGAIKGTLDNLNFSGSGMLPLVIDSADATAMFASGFQFGGAFKYENGATEFQMQDPVDGNFSGTTSSDGGSLSVSMDKAVLKYGVAAKNSAVNVTGDQIPFGLSVKMEESVFDLTMPLAKSEESQNFGLAMTLGNFAMDDTLWNMFDPSGALPRDPATISFDLEGKAQILVDLIDPEEAGAVAATGVSPVELGSLSLKNLLVSVAGAALTGSGDFTFDNTQDFNGIPKPTGAIDLKLVGGNGLLDNLVKMGILPDEQAMGARMMMGLFTVPGEAEDTLNSKIEINEQGHILANGQRIQ